MIDLSVWVKQARERANITQDGLAESLSVTKAAVSAMENNRSKPSFEQMIRIAKLTGIPLPYQDVLLKEEIPEGMIKYNVLDIVAALGNGSENPDYPDIIDAVVVAETWARQQFGSNYQRIHVITTKGDSMEGTISEGDVLFVDPSINYLNGDGLYVIHTCDGLRAKRLQMMVNGKLKIISDNEKYPPEILSGDDLDSLKICGKIVGSWAFHKL